MSVRYEHFRGNHFYRYGPHLAYRLVLRDESTWRDIRGVFWATKEGTYWLHWDTWR